MYIPKVTIAALFICQLTMVPETLMSNNQAIFHVAINSLNEISENCSDKSTEIMKTYSLAISDLMSVFYQQNEKITELEVDNVHLKDEIEFLKEELSKSGENAHFRIKREPMLAEYKEWPGFPSPNRRRTKSDQQEPDHRFFDFGGKNNYKKMIRGQERVKKNSLPEVPYVLQSMYRNDLEDYWDQRRNDLLEEDIDNFLKPEGNQGYREQNQLFPTSVQLPEYGFYDAFNVPHLKPKDERKPIIIKTRNQPYLKSKEDGRKPIIIKPRNQILVGVRSAKDKDVKTNRNRKILRNHEEINVNYLEPVEEELNSECEERHLQTEAPLKAIEKQTIYQQEPIICNDPSIRINFLKKKEMTKPKEIFPKKLKPEKKEEPNACVEDSSVNINFFEPSEDEEPKAPEVYSNPLQPVEKKKTNESLLRTNLETLEKKKPPPDDKIYIDYSGGDSQNEDVPNIWDYGDEQMVLDPLPDGPWNLQFDVQAEEIGYYQKQSPYGGIPMTPVGMIPGGLNFGNPWGMIYPTIMIPPQPYWLQPMMIDQYRRPEMTQGGLNIYGNNILLTQNPGSLPISKPSDQNIFSTKTDSSCYCPPCNEIVAPHRTIKVNPECKHFVGSSLLEVVKRGCNNLVGEIVNKINVNKPDQKGVTALHLAAKRGYIDVMNTLIKAGADINALDNNKNTALHYCAKGGSAEACSLLLSMRSNTNIQNSDRATALHIAVWKGNYEIVRMLLDYSDSFQITDNFGRSALDLAHQMNYDDIIELVKESGVKSKNPSTMHTACGRYPSNESAIAACGSIASSSLSEPEATFIKKSEKRGIDKFIKPEKFKTTEVISKHLNNKEKELFDSSKVNSMLGGRVAKLCIEGLNVNIADIDRNSSTALHVAASVGVKLTTLLLIRCGAEVNAKDIDGNTPLHLAVMNGKYWVADILLHFRADPYAVNNFGETPQKLAINSTEFAIRGLFDVRLLKWFKPERKLNKREKGIHRWAKTGYYLGISKMCAEGIDINFKDIDDNLNSALHLAVSGSKNNEETVLTLLRCGANMHSRDRNGNTPLHLAILNEQADVVVALLVNNADPLIPNNDGQTAFQLGQASNEPSIRDTFTSDRYLYYMGHPINTSR